MTNDQRKSAALDALRVWRKVVGDRGRLVANARACGATLAEIMDASGLAKGTVRKASDASEDAMETSAARTRNPYDHPNLVDCTSTGFGGWRTEWRPFTGAEPRPDLATAHPDWHLAYRYDDPERQRLKATWRNALALWTAARFNTALRPLLARALPTWQAYQQARKAVDAAYAALMDAEDSKWRSGVLRLHEAHDELRRTVRAWDTEDHAIAACEQKYGEGLPEDDRPQTRFAAAELGYDVSGWDLHSSIDFDPAAGGSATHRSPGQVEKLIQQQVSRIRQVSDTAGDR